MHVFSPLAKLIPAVMLVACTSIPVSSMLALSRIDFTTTRIEDLRVAVEIPSAIAPREGGVHLEVLAKQGEKVDKFVFKLAEDQPQIGLKGLLPFPAPGKIMYAYRLRDEDVLKLTKLRAERLEAKKDGEKGSLSMGISAREFCRKVGIDNDALTITTFIATSETNGFIVLIRDYDVRSDKTISDSIDNMPPC
jgi:hypothetical protein